MANKTINILIVLVILVIVVNIILFTGFFKGNLTGKDVEVPNDTIRIGVILPLTGDAAAYGIPLQRTTRFAVNEINKAGGINNKKLDVIYEDGKCNPRDATNAAQKLININNVRIIQGGMCSGETLGAAPVAESNKVILFSPGSGSPEITYAGDYIFRNFPSDASSGNKIALTAIKNNHKKIAILSEQTDYAQAVVDVFKRTFEKNNGKIVSEERFASDSNDFKTQIAKIRSKNPDAIYLVPQIHKKIGIILKQFEESRFDKQIYSNEMAIVEEILDEYSRELEGTIIAVPRFNEDDPLTKEIMTELRNNIDFGSMPPVYIATTYDNIQIIKEALEECGENTDCIKNYLYSIENRQGVAGTLTIDENGDAHLEYVLKVIRNGKPEELN
ncbi:ABC transporter substrate-binding protein [Candidatus Pacearchaeota archaeon]|nr:ABC transporter substrate-binding protein [Candidatus Pacearchaeota archaeon]MBD3283577.1 ABC transporter substrate-binding protein [Candidatus Pacearchaeota archaeon]